MIAEAKEMAAAAAQGDLEATVEAEDMEMAATVAEAAGGDGSSSNSAGRPGGRS